MARRLVPAPRIRLLRDPPGPADAAAALAARTALITGAGRNIGRGIALEMARHGAEVLFTDIDAASVASLQAELEASGARARGWVSDIGQAEDVDLLSENLRREGALVDVLVNNAGIDAGGGVLTLQREDVRRVFETNVFGPLQLTRNVTRELVAAGRPGSVLFLTSVHAQSTSTRPAYSASKAALTALVRELAHELAPHGIRVNGIAPGGVTATEADELPPFAGARLLGSYIHPLYIARAAVYLSAEHYSRFTTGTVLTVDAGLLTRPQVR
jgi:NAD(P)-dependent dehydrogenase (short-subunit alcohol dehydrogenase family)